jgi:hypothetical protein
MRRVVGGRVEIERAFVRLCAQRHFDQVRFDDFTRQLDKPSNPAGLRTRAEMRAEMRAC